MGKNKTNKKKYELVQPVNIRPDQSNVIQCNHTIITANSNSKANTVYTIKLK